jgi:hypothetical protein
MTNNTAKKDFNSIKMRLAKSIHSALFRECDPPPDELIIPYAPLVCGDEPGVAYAQVIYKVFCPREKLHTINIKFQYDKFGNFMMDTMTYVDVEECNLYNR